jgi:hypothetical protein
MRLFAVFAEFSGGWFVFYAHEVAVVFARPVGTAFAEVPPQIGISRLSELHDAVTVCVSRLIGNPNRSGVGVWPQ